MKLQPQIQTTAKAPHVMVEIIGRDGLIHHVGPFRTHADAQIWILQNAPDNAPFQGDVAKKFATRNSRDPASSD